MTVAPAPIRHRTLAELEAALADIAQSPADVGRLELIVRRPETDVREALERGQLTAAQGLEGDSWRARRRPRAGDDTQTETQLTLMNARVIGLLAGERARWPLAGDQLFVDLDLSAANLPPGTRLAIGDQAVIEIATVPHAGCGKFANRFGVDALKFVNGAERRPLRLRGVYARVVRDGAVRTGDVITKLG